MFPVNAMLSQKTCPAVSGLQTAHSRSRPCRAQRMVVKASSSNERLASPLSLRALGVLAAVQIAISGPALAGLPSGDAIRDQLPKGGNPAEKVKDQVGKVADPGDVAAKAGSAASKAKSSVKQEANGAGGNPAGDLSGGLPGSNVSKDDLPDGPKPGQALKNLPSGSAGSQVSSQVGKAASKGGSVADKAGSAAKDIKGKNPFGDLSGGLPGSNISKDDLPDGPKPGQALKNLPSGSAGSQVSSQVGNAASKGGSVADKAGSAAKDIKGKNPFGDLSGGLPGSNVSKDDLPDGPKPGQALKNLPSGSAGSQVSSQVGKAASKGGSVADKAGSAAKDIKGKNPFGDLSGGLPGSNVSKDDLPDGPKPGQALKNLPSGSAGSQVSSQVGKAASKGGSVADKAGSAAKDIKGKNPFGDLSGGLPGSNVSKDDLPDGPKPGQALKNLPSGSAGSQVSSQVGKAASNGGSVADKAGSAAKDIKGKNPFGDLSGGLPGSNVSKDDLPDGPKPGQALKNLPSGTAGSQVSEQVGKAASKGGSVADKAGGAVKDIKGKNPLGDLSGGLPGSSVTKDDLPNGPKPGAAVKDLPGSPDLSGQVGKAADKAAGAAGQAKNLGKEATRKGLE